MTPSALASSQRDTGQPKDEEDYSQDPQEMNGETDPGEQEYQ
jgi:hypothetical protein